MSRALWYSFLIWNQSAVQFGFDSLPHAFQLRGIRCSDKVKLEMIPSKDCKDFAVLVRVTAPQQCIERFSVDLVAVVDVSGSMTTENRLPSMKQAMEFVINHLGQDDRLSIVSFSSQPHHIMELSVMSDENRNVAITKVNNLTASGGTNMGSALQLAAKVHSRACRVLALHPLSSSFIQLMSRYSSYN